MPSRPCLFHHGGIRMVSPAMVLCAPITAVDMILRQRHIAATTTTKTLWYHTVSNNTMYFFFSRLMINFKHFKNQGRRRQQNLGVEETSSSEDAPSEEEKPKVGQVSLTVSRLEAMHSLASLGGDEMSTFAQLGVDMQRIRSVLREGVCDCGCSMPANDLFRVCSYFWKLPKAAQDACLWSIQSECKQRRRRWFLEGLFGGVLLLIFAWTTLHQNGSGSVFTWHQDIQCARRPGSVF